MMTTNFWSLNRDKRIKQRRQMKLRRNILQKVRPDGREHVKKRHPLNYKSNLNRTNNLNNRNVCIKQNKLIMTMTQRTVHSLNVRRRGRGIKAEGREVPPGRGTFNSVMGEGR